MIKYRILSNLTFYIIVKKKPSNNNLILKNRTGLVKAGLF